MPNLTEPAGRNRPAVVPLVLGPTVALADALVAAGLTVPLPVVVAAMIDTGASDTLVDRAVIDRLGLAPLGEREVQVVGPAGVTTTGRVYRVSVRLAVGPPQELASAAPVVAVDDLTDCLRVGVLLGRDLLDRCVLVYNGPAGTFTLAF